MEVGLGGGISRSAGMFPCRLRLSLGGHDGGIAFHGLCLRIGVGMGEDAVHGVVFCNGILFCAGPCNETGDVSLSAWYAWAVLHGLLGEQVFCGQGSSFVGAGA